MLVRRFAFAVGLLVAALFSQAPEFAQQYRQRLAGAVDEIARVLAGFDDDAGREGLDRAGGIARLKGNTDPLVRERGLQIEDEAARLARLTRQQTDFARSGPVMRLWVAASEFDPAIARRALGDFEPAAPLTSEGLGSALVGFLTGLGLTHAAVAPFRRRRRAAA